MAAPCARSQLVREPVRRSGRGRPFNGIVRHQMAKSEPASFLNLDLEIESTTSLSRLGDHLKKSSYVLSVGRTRNGHRLTAEPVIRGRLSANAKACTKHFLDLLENLPEDLAKLFRRAKVRVFDYGFDGGLESNPIAIDISQEHLARIAQLGIEVRVTVYPYRKRV